MTYKIVEELREAAVRWDWTGAATADLERRAAAHIEALAGLLVVARRYALPTSLERSIDTALSNLREGQGGEQ